MLCLSTPLDLAVPFPDNPIEGNDDPRPPLGDGEKSNPYVSNAVAAVGEIYDADGPGVEVRQNWGQVGTQYEYSHTVNFRDFGRVQLFDGSRGFGDFWFRISDYIPWHIVIKATFFGPEPSWHNDGSNADFGYANP